MHPEHRSIGELAYHLWQARGCPEGSAEQDWLDAERQLRSGPRAVEPTAAADQRSDEPVASAEPHSGRGRLAGERTAPGAKRSDEPVASAEPQWKAPRAPRAPPTGSPARP